MVRAAMIVLLLLCMQAASQVKVVRQHKPSGPGKYRTSKLGIGVGRSRSVLFLMRNFKQDNDAHGWNVSAAYNLNRVMRINAEYIWYNPIDIAPTWYNVKGRSIECNITWLFHFPDGKTKFYPLTGLSLNTFKGFFTGTYDHLNLRSIYEPNSDAVTRWLGVNGGCGVEYYVRPLSFYGEFRMRAGVSDSNRQLTIMDVCLSAGIRYNLAVPSLPSLFDGTRRRYILRLKEAEE